VSVADTFEVTMDKKGPLDVKFDRGQLAEVCSVAFLSPYFLVAVFFFVCVCVCVLLLLPLVWPPPRWRFSLCFHQSLTFDRSPRCARRASSS
jgi:hypothetical protein